MTPFKFWPAVLLATAIGGSVSARPLSKQEIACQFKRPLVVGAAGERLKLKDGRDGGLYEMRPDGVHLSERGSVYASETMQAQWETNPPACNLDKKKMSYYY